MKNFDDVYNQLKSSDCSELIKSYKKDIILKLLLAILFVIFVCAVYFFEIKLFYKYLFLIASIFLFVILIKSFHLRSYAKNYKKYIISKLVEYYDDSFKFSSQYSISPSTYLDGDFEQRFDQYHSEDCIKGLFENKFPFEMSEIKVELEHKDYDSQTHKTTTSYSTLFNGLFIKISHDKNLSCVTYVRKRVSFTKSLFTTNVSKVHKNDSILDPVQEISIDDSDFESLYLIETNNRILTMQIFTSEFMRYIIDFKNKYKIVPEITIKNEKIFIRFYISSTLFEPPFLKSPLTYSDVQKQYNFINSIMQICSYLLKNINGIEL